ncbi:MAG: Rab family GTPase [Promethearchaeota archaeon]|jgi:small GTP-binding protein
MYDAIFKAVIFGDMGCGKTTLRKRFMTNEYDSNCRRTIGVDFQTKDCKYNKMDVKLMLWDFAGEERFRYMFPQYLYGAMGGIMMYDITNYSSFSHISNWISLLRETNQNFPLILLGGKLDLGNIRKVSREKAVEVAKSLGFTGFIECSSKSGENVVEVFEALTRLMLTTNMVNEGDVQSIAT